ncbi:M24 family metallopeptidase [Segeticoccus rhizosphaerae]|uniref:M24 family metallopeptidase n=1 Tax=Segeticoccus rhizosphaerae TaxID=1104777 RepID=UPI0010C00762|nr:Xaa-Pro peptidase family protein [Ornithinicoccus soli]
MERLGQQALALEYGWTDSPQGRAPVETRGIDWGGVLSRRLERLQDGAATQQLDILILANPGNVIFSTTWPRYRPSAHEGAYLAVLDVRNRRLAIFASEGDELMVREDAAFHEIFVLPPWNGAWYEAIVDSHILPDTATLAVGMDRAAYQILADPMSNAHPDWKVAGVDSLLAEARALKSQPEVDAYKETLAVVEVGINKAIRLVKGGAFRRTELEIASAANYALMLKGCTQADIWCTSGPRAAPVRRFPSNRYLRRGEFVVIDGGGIYNGFRSEFARTVWTGGVLSTEQRNAYLAVYEALEAGERELRPGADTAEIEMTCLEVVGKAGLSDFYGGYPYTGHGIGIGAEPPYITSRFEVYRTSLQAGMLINLEPAVWIPGVGGVRLENTYLITQDGAVCLSSAPYDSDLVEPSSPAPGAK